MMIRFRTMAGDVNVGDYRVDYNYTDGIYDTTRNVVYTVVTVKT